ncbi:MAG: T9SS type A sorting domain-containing protein [Saprospiraceae bacterium]|nr:T9SS type A sorting domain-containing protein [Candidatus Defluviibacterium haderslevense]
MTYFIQKFYRLLIDHVKIKKLNKLFFMASLNGKIVQQFNLKAINKIDISNFHAGVYVIHIQDHPQIVTRVVIE